jgi:hypothetical protein
VLIAVPALIGIMAVNCCGAMLYRHQCHRRFREDPTAPQGA